jgi:hypothetical protein
VARYPVRFGRDNDANLIDLSAFTRTTVEAMRSWPAPGIIPPANRISPYETTVLALEVTLIEYRQERSLDSSDYRLVLADRPRRPTGPPDANLQILPTLGVPGDGEILEGGAPAAETARGTDRAHAWSRPFATCS